ncbi:Chromatin assembly factor 1 subunit B, partial [Fasciola gigantica]
QHFILFAVIFVLRLSSCLDQPNLLFLAPPVSFQMRLLTPEIAWHETLPVYSCDLQHRSSTPISTDVSKLSDRSPLSDITSCIPADCQVDSAHSRTITAPSWTRLATAGGDNVVRLWRVRLAWVSPNSNANRIVVNNIPESSAIGKKNTTNNNAHMNLTEHLTYLASLKRHEKPVNVVRWSPSGDYLASAGDDLFVIIWSNQTSSNTESEVIGGAKDGLDNDDDEEETAISLERWVPCRSLRRHLEDIYDLCWSPDGQALISGSVDHSVIIWQLNLEPTSSSSGSPAKTLTNGFVGSAPGTSCPSSTNNEKTDLVGTNPGPDVPLSSATTVSGGVKSLIVRDHKHYVQGVTWDPMGFYVASLSSDRACRIYRAGTRTCLAHVSKAGKQRLFQDDSWKSFFRRLSFSPDGLLLACPAGNLEEAVFAGSVAAAASLSAAAPSYSYNSDSPRIPSVAPQHAVHIFLRCNFTRPAVSLPTGPRPVVCVRFCPQPFQLRPTHLLNGAGDRAGSLFDLPYRWMFCLILEDGVLFFDTQQTTPFAQVSQFHYQALNDASWSKDGHLLVVCSTDGYCSLIHFARGELGTPYNGPIGADAVARDFKPTSVGAYQPATDKPTMNELTPLALEPEPVHVEPKRVTVPSVSDEDQGHKPAESAQNTPTMNTTPTALTGSTIRKRRVALTTLSSGIEVHQTASNVMCSENRSNSSGVAVTPLAEPKTPESSTTCEPVTTPVSVRKRRVTFVTLTSQLEAFSSSPTTNSTAQDHLATKKSMKSILISVPSAASDEC